MANTVNKTSLIDEIAKQTKLSKKDAGLFIDSFADIVKKEVSSGNKVQLIGFGSFELRHRAARKGRNPQTGKEIQIAASNVPAFKPGKAFKEEANK